MDSNNPYWAFFTPFPLTGPVSYADLAGLYAQDGNDVSFTSGYNAANQYYGYNEYNPTFGTLVGSTRVKFPDGMNVYALYHDAGVNNLVLIRHANGNDNSNASFKSLRINGYKYNRADANVSTVSGTTTYTWFVSSPNVMANNVVYTPIFSTNE